MKNDQEQKLVEKAKTNPDAFGELYDYYYPKILNYTLHRTNNLELSQDIATDVFMKALDRIKDFTWRGVPFSAWLYRIANNTIADHFRGRHAKIISLDFLLEEQGFEPVSDTDIEADLIAAQEEIARHKQFLAVHKQLLTLPAKYQEVLSLRYFEHKTIAEISQIMGKRPGTIKSLLSRGTKKLREGGK